MEKDSNVESVFVNFLNFLKSDSKVMKSSQKSIFCEYLKSPFLFKLETFN